jgi:hypothetical protein
VTHPFHPWFGQEFEFVVVRHTWGEDRVFFFAQEGTQKSLPRAWTSEADPDAFAVVADGRSAFRVEDLLVLADVVEELSSGRRQRRSVRRTTPPV